MVTVRGACCWTGIWFGQRAAKDILETVGTSTYRLHRDDAARGKRPDEGAGREKRLGVERGSGVRGSGRRKGRARTGPRVRPRGGQEGRRARPRPGGQREVTVGQGPGSGCFPARAGPPPPPARVAPPPTQRAAPPPVMAAGTPQAWEPLVGNKLWVGLPTPDFWYPPKSPAAASSAEGHPAGIAHPREVWTLAFISLAAVFLQAWPSCHLGIPGTPSPPRAAPLSPRAQPLANAAAASSFLLYSPLPFF